MSRLFQFRYSYQRDITDIFAKVSFGSSGAPTLVYGKGVVSISRVSAGKYTITIKDAYNSLLFAQDTFKNAAAPAAPIMYVSADNSGAASPNVQIQFNNAAGTATDPASGEIVYLNLSFQNAST